MRYGHLAMSLFCAWVLWNNVYENGVWRWDIVSALDNREACAQQLHKSMPDPNDTNWKMLSEGIVNSNNPELLGHVSFMYKCLPDTVDPRAPKAVR